MFVHCLSLMPQILHAPPHDFTSCTHHAAQTHPKANCKGC
jgi:hypothetical protein